MLDDNTLNVYINDFFDNLELYDDQINGHYYKELLKASIDIFLCNETNTNAIEVYQQFLMIYQIVLEDKSARGNVGNLIGEPNPLLDFVKLMNNYTIAERD